MRAVLFPLLLFLRLAAAGLTSVLGVVPVAVGEGCRPGTAFRKSRARSLRRFLENNGPVGIKIGQYFALRGDLLGDETIAELRKLQRRARPLSQNQVILLLDRVFDPADSGYTLVDACIGSGSFCHVALVSTAGQEAFCIKLLKPGVRRALEDAIALMRGAGKAIAYFRLLGSTPVVRALDQICDTLLRQADLQQEAGSLEKMRGSFGWDRGIRFPVPIAAYSSQTALAMEHIDHLVPIDRALSEDRAPVDLLERFVRAVYKMMLTDGLVHVDLHPGNVFVEERSGNLVLLDFGLIASLDFDTRHLFRSFFAAFVHGDGLGAAGIVLKMAEYVPENLDKAAFFQEVSGIIDRYHEKSAGSFDVTGFVAELFAVQRRHRIAGNTDIITTLIALVTVEGIVRASDPDFDFQAVARDYIGLTRYQLT